MMTQREVALTAPRRTMRGVIFTALQGGQRTKHENELRRMGFEVESRDYPRSYTLDAYEVVFVVKDHADNGDKDRAQDAARRSGKPWFWLTKKLSNPTWEALSAWAKKQGLEALEDRDTHEPTFSGPSFADVLSEHLAKKNDADDWAKLAGEYEVAAKEAEARLAEIEALWRQSEIDIKDLRKRLQTAAEDANATAAQREALRAEVVRLQTELTKLREAKALGQKAVAKVDGDVQARLRDTDTLMRQAREERDQVTEELRKVKKELAEAKKVVGGLQDTIDSLTQKLAAKPPMMASTVVAAEIPAGKRLVPANIEQTAERLWTLYEDGVMDIEEVWAKLMVQLKGGNDDD